jgi:uncharacterized protein (TIGR03067 family)
MINSALLVTTLALLAADPNDDLDRLQGTWKLTRSHRARVDREGIECEWLIKGNALTITETIHGRGTIRLDPTTNPGRCEQTFADDPKSKASGDYVLEGDTFKTYLDHPIVKSATDPPNTPGVVRLQQVWERVGGAKGDTLDGDWKLVETILGGRRNKFQDFTMKVERGEYTSRNHSVTHCILKLEPSLQLKQMDITYTLAEENLILAGKTRLGIYRLDGDRLTVWDKIERPGQNVRPTEVSDAPDSENSFQVFRRVKPPAD